MFKNKIDPAKKRISDLEDKSSQNNTVRQK